MPKNSSNPSVSGPRPKGFVKSISVPASSSALAVAAALLGAVSAIAGAQADPVADFYRGRQVGLIVGYGTGGGYDVYARMLMPYLAKALDATVVVQNQPGAGGMTALGTIDDWVGTFLIVVLALVQIVAFDIANGKPLSKETQDRMLVAYQRIDEAMRYANV